MNRALFWTSLAVRLAAAGGIAYLIGREGFMMGDTPGYLAIAENLLAGHGYSQSVTAPFLPDAMRTPVYPLLLAGSFSLGGPWLIILLQILMASTLPLLVRGLVRSSGFGDRAGAGAAWFTALEPNMIMWSVYLVTETTFLFFFLASFALMVSFRGTHAPGQAAAAGALLGLAALTRPLGAYLLLFYGIWCVAVGVGRIPARRLIHCLLALVIGFGVVVAPWLIRNKRTFGTTTLATAGFQTIYSNFGASILTLRGTMRWADAQDSLERAFAETHGIAPDAFRRDVGLNTALTRAGITFIREHWRDALRVETVITATFFTNDAYTYFLQRAGLLPLLPVDLSPSATFAASGLSGLLVKLRTVPAPTLVAAATGRTVWVTLTLLAAVGSMVRVARRRHRAATLLFVSIILYFLAASSTIGFGVNARLRYPVNPLIFLLALEGISILSKIKSEGFREVSADRRSPVV